MMAKQFAKKLEKHRDKIAAERDALREMVSDAQDLDRRAHV